VGLTFRCERTVAMAIPQQRRARRENNGDDFCRRVRAMIGIPTSDGSLWDRVGGCFPIVQALHVDAIGDSGQTRSGCPDVLKVGHHGSAYSSTPEFIAAIQPRYALISVGRRNLFGHPAQTTLTTLQQLGATVYRTDRCGAISVEAGARNHDNSDAQLSIALSLYPKTPVVVRVNRYSSFRMRTHRDGNHSRPRSGRSA
jgi:hypothetical protein